MTILAIVRSIGYRCKVFSPLFTVAISVGSLLLSACTLYWTTLRAAHLVVFHGPMVQLHHFTTEELSIVVPLTLQNIGGREMTVRAVALKASGPGFETFLRPYGLVAFDQTTGNTGYTGWLTPDILVRGTPVSRAIQFGSAKVERWPLQAGEYFLEVLIWADLDTKPTVADKFSLTISAVESQVLNSATGVVNSVPSDIRGLTGK
jgi:hypothetical protein